jgi:hypothetical protein
MPQIINICRRCAKILAPHGSCKFAPAVSDSSMKIYGFIDVFLVLNCCYAAPNTELLDSSVGNTNLSRDR